MVAWCLYLVTLMRMPWNMKVASIQVTVACKETDERKFASFKRPVDPQVSWLHKHLCGRGGQEICPPNRPSEHARCGNGRVDVL